MLVMCTAMRRTTFTRTFVGGTLSLLAWLLTSVSCHAQDWGGSIAAVSDYVTRGLSQTRGDPSLQAGVHRTFPHGWSLGAGAATVDLGDWIDANYELNLNVARTWTLGERWSAQLSYTRYIYPDERGDHDYGELAGSLSYHDLLTATIAYFPHVSVYSRVTTAWSAEALAIELSALQPVSERWSLLGGMGYYELPDPFRKGYLFWSLGLAFSWNALQLDLLRIDTDRTARQLFGTDRAGSRWSAALMWKF